MRRSLFVGVAISILLSVAAVATETAVGKTVPFAVAWKGETKRIQFPLDETAAELARCLGLVLGVDVPHATWDEAPAAETLFLLTDASHVPQIRDELQGQPRDAFVIKYPFQYEGRSVD